MVGSCGFDPLPREGTGFTDLLPEPLALAARKLVLRLGFEPRTARF